MIIAALPYHLSKETRSRSKRSHTKWVLQLAFLPYYCILSEEMAEDRRTGSPVLSATGSYVEYIPGAESPVRRSSETFSPVTLAKAAFWPKKVA